MAKEDGIDSALKDKLYIFGILTIVGLVLGLKGEGVFGPGIAIAGAIAFVTEVVPVVVSKRKRAKALAQIDMATLREGDLIVRSILADLPRAREIDLLGNVLNDLFAGGDRRVLEGLKNREDHSNVRIRVCVYAPRRDNHILEQRARDEATTRTPKEQFEHLIAFGQNVQQTIRDLKKIYKDSIELRYVAKTYILNSIIRIDDKLIVIDYLHQTGSKSPAFVFRPGSIQEIYKKEFERMWLLAEKADLAYK